MEDFYGFGKALRALRRERGESVAALAERIHVPVERVQEWEQGGEPPTVAQLERALEALGASRGALVQWLERLEIEGD
jgi:transcriptional regulator with XRE-family HTH domain